MPYDETGVVVVHPMILKARNDELDAQALALAKELHSAYAQTAPKCGFTTARDEPAVFDISTMHGKIMIATCRDLLERGVVEPGILLRVPWLRIGG